MSGEIKDGIYKNFQEIKLLSDFLRIICLHAHFTQHFSRLVLAVHSTLAFANFRFLYSMDINPEQLFDLYRKDIISTFEHLHQCGTWTIKQCNTTVPEYYEHYKTSFTNKFGPKISQLGSFIVDMTPPGEELFLYQGMLDAYCWITICLLINAFHFVLGRAILSYFLSSNYSFVAAAFIVPAWLIYYCYQSEFSDDKRRLCVLFWSATDGLLMGSALGYKRIDVGGPPAIAITLSIVIAAICYNKRFGQQCRPIFLAVTLAPGVIFAFLLGSILGDLSFAYFVWLNLLLLVSCIDLQLKIGRLREGSTAGIGDQICSIIVFNLVAYLCIFLFSSSKNE